MRNLITAWATFSNNSNTLDSLSNRKMMPATKGGNSMKKLSVAVCLFACLGSTAAIAQTSGAATPAAAPAAPAPAQAVMVLPTSPSSNSMLPRGTPIRLRTLQQLHSQENRVGDRFDLEVAEDVMLNGIVIIPRGSRANGEVTRIRRKGMWGRSGRIETRLLSVQANGITIPISGAVSEHGDTGTAGVVASIVVLPVAGFFVTGTSAILPVGTGFNATTDSDVPLVIPDGARPAPQALVVPASAPH
ncbi:MAG: hypothetical protein JO276_10665 [Sphingomonadaceae bacterium]|nr:hypothetical protein [Sphingomonadaceae bacterium]